MDNPLGFAAALHLLHGFAVHARELLRLSGIHTICHSSPLGTLPSSRANQTFLMIDGLIRVERDKIGQDFETLTELTKIKQLVLVKG